MHLASVASVSVGALALLVACGGDPPSANTTTAASTGSAGGAGGVGGASSASSSSSEGGAAPSYPAPYTLTPFDDVRITSDASEPNFQRADASIDLASGPFQSVRLIVDLATTCFPFESWTKPPDGENWPADCDAFDRNFELSIDDPDDAESGPPGLEILRAITPFGGPLHTEVDLTDLANGLPGAHKLRVVIPTWSDATGQVSGSHGGWNVTAKIEVVPGPAPREVLAVVPLYNAYKTSPDPVDPVVFDVPGGATTSRIEYRATGHGGGAIGAGCSGPAEEFCRRKHTVKVDDETLLQKALWRSDCGELCTVAHYGPADGGFDYCAENPCGNMGSVRASRANWCPGSVTPPIELIPTLVPGQHRFSFDIATIEEGGGWRLSAVYYAYGP